VTWGTVGYLVHRRVCGLRGVQSGDNLIDIIGLLKNAYLPNAKWFTRRSVITKIRKFKDSTGQSIWMPPSAGYTETIMGYPVVRMEDMPALAASSFSLAFGDMAASLSDRRSLRHPRAARPLHVEALHQVLHHQAHRRRRGELRSHQAHEVHLILPRGD
jgi:HK97 family phage major capsid protein